MNNNNAIKSIVTIRKLSDKIMNTGYWTIEAPPVLVILAIRATNSRINIFHYLTMWSLS